MNHVARDICRSGHLQNAIVVVVVVDGSGDVAVDGDNDNVAIDGDNDTVDGDEGDVSAAAVVEPCRFLLSTRARL